MKIGIDCRFWGIAHAGLGRYTRELVLAIAKLPHSDLNLTLFFRRNVWKKDADLLKNCHMVEVDMPHYSVQEQLFFGDVVDKESLDLMHFPHFNVPFLLKTPYVATIHDLIKHFFRGRSVTTRFLPIYWLKHWGYRIVIAAAIKHAQKICVPSYFVYDQLAVNYPGSEKKLRVTPEGVSVAYQKAPKPSTKKLEKILGAYALRQPYFVYTGSAYPFKNIGLILEALTSLVTNSGKPQLLIACARNVFWERLQKQVQTLDLEDQVILPGSVPDKDLILLYQGAAAFVTASMMEGFGLPGLEAMASGCPVLAANAGSLPEVYGKVATYFHPDDNEGLAQKMRWAMALTPKQRQNIVESGKKQASGFQWEKTALATLKVYEETLMGL